MMYRQWPKKLIHPQQQLPDCYKWKALFFWVFFVPGQAYMAVEWFWGAD